MSSVHLASRRFNCSIRRNPIFEVNSQDVYVCHGAISNKQDTQPSRQILHRKKHLPNPIANKTPMQAACCGRRDG